MRHADCHPSKRHYAKGKCLECYNRDVAAPRAREWYATNKERAASKTAAWRRANPEKVKAARRRWNAKHGTAANARYLAAHPGKKSTIAHGRTLLRYGITRAEYEAMLAKQGGVCALCERPPGSRRLNVDHCHESGRVRGLLCNICNMTMGFVDKSASYVERLGRYAHGG